uniref:Uncharacterized protein n=1 Tax=Anopheles minimus TaxID=112268 RepID=A0A182WNQ5_9DIPT
MSRSEDVQTSVVVGASKQQNGTINSRLLWRRWCVARACVLTLPSDLQQKKKTHTRNSRGTPFGAGSGHGESVCQSVSCEPVRSVSARACMTKVQHTHSRQKA